MTKYFNLQLFKNIGLLLIGALIVFLIMNNSTCRGKSTNTPSIAAIKKQPLNKDVVFWKDKYNNEHATVQQITLDKEQLKKFSDSIAQILKIKTKQVNNLTSIKTSLNVGGEIETYEYTVIDSTGCRKVYNFSLDKKFQPWLTASGRVGLGKGKDSIYITGIDTIEATRYWTRKWFLGNKTYHTDITNKNKYISIMGVKSVGEEQKDPRWIIGPTVQLGYNSFISPNFSNPKLSWGISILYYPASIKIK